MENIEIKSEYIKLDQFLKWVGVVGMGSEAKDVILNGEIKVNGEVEERRGRKLYPNDIVEVFGKKYKVITALSFFGE